MTVDTSETLALLSARDLHQEFNGTEIVHGVDLDVYTGEFVHLAGPSGSGKTTVLNMMAGLSVPTCGEVVHAEQIISQLAPEERTEWRANHAGIIFQHSGLLGGLTVRENIITPHELKSEYSIDRERAGFFISRLGLSHLLSRPAAKLSGGERQRAAFARAIIHSPEIVFADEPTASLDTHAKREFTEVIRQLVDESGLTVLMVSHDAVTEDYADRTISLRDGKNV